MAILQLSGVSKSFGAIQALDGVSLELNSGEILGLMGDNGAGKSTLVKIIAGNFKPTKGTITIEGREAEFHRPIDARNSGVEIVYQDLALCDNLSAAVNVFLGRELTTGFGPFKIMNYAAMNARAGELFKELRSETRPRDLVRVMSGGQRQAVAIARTRLSKAKILLMDEPTAAISVRQVAEVLNLIRELKRQNLAVILISHRMPDVFAVADRIAVLRRGRKVADKPTGSTSPHEITGLITGAIENQPEASAKRTRAMTVTLDEAIKRQTHSFYSWIMTRPAFWVFLAAAIACLVLSVLTDTFATPQNLFNVTRNFAFVAIIALGMTVVIISGGIDLSVGSTLCISAMVLAIVMNAGFGLAAGIAAALAASLLVGAINGYLIAYVRIPPFVATLGMLSVARSAAMVLSNNRMIYQFGPDEKALFWLGGGSTLGIANPVIALVLLAISTGLMLKWSRWGTRIFAIGSNQHAALLTGVPVRRLKVSVYMFSSLTAGIAGILEAGWLGGVTTNLGQSMELSVIAATVIGGANLMGGAGTAFGAVVGAALIEVIRNSLTLLGISSFWQGAFVGSFIVLAVAFDRLRANRELEE